MFFDGQKSNCQAWFALDETPRRVSAYDAILRLLDDCCPSVLLEADSGWVELR